MNETTTVAAGPRTYRGETLESLLPQIRAELGADAVIVRQREGLVGGVGGFFQKRCVEVEARPAEAGIDAYDEEPEGFGEAEGCEAAEGRDAAGAPRAGSEPVADSEPHPIRNDAATREGLATPALQKLLDQAQPFAAALSEAGGAVAAADLAVAAAAEPASAPAEPAAPLGPPKAEALRQAMTANGLGEDLAREVVDAVVASALPFATPGRLRTLVRTELALRLPVAPAAAPGPRTIVAVGPAGAGKSTALEAIAAAHSGPSARVERIRLDQLAAHGGSAPGLLLIDTPPLWGGAEELAEAAARLAELADPEVHLVIRAGTAAAAAAELRAGLAPLRPNRLLVTGAGETSHLGGVLDLAIRAGLPLSYVAASAREIVPADPRELARRAVP